MRITTGYLKGRVVKMPRRSHPFRGKGIRPTQDKVRKAIFDILQGEISESSFLELFAGSGAVGIEAFSTGSKEVVFVDKDIRCCKTVEDNLKTVGFNPVILYGSAGYSICSGNRSRERDVFILATDTIRAIEGFHRQKRKFQVIFLDPPYCRELAKKTLQKLSAYDILSTLGLVIIEHSKKDELQESIGDLTCFKQKRYGDTLLSFYRRLTVANRE